MLQINTQKLGELFEKQTNQILQNHGSMIKYELGQDIILLLIQDFLFRFKVALDLLEEKNLIASEKKAERLKEFTTPEAQTNFYESILGHSLDYLQIVSPVGERSEIESDIKEIKNIEDLMKLYAKHFEDDPKPRYLESLVYGYEKLCKSFSVSPDNIVSILEK